LCEGITPEILRSVLENFESKFRLCLRNNNGGNNIQGDPF